MKIMVVSSSKPLQASLARVLKMLLKGVDETLETDHEEALELFLTEEPDRVIVCEYDEEGYRGEEYNRGKFTYRDIKNSASDGTVVLRLGLSSYDYDDYVRAPFKLPEIFEKLRLS